MKHTPLQPAGFCSICDNACSRFASAANAFASRDVAVQLYQIFLEQDAIFARGRWPYKSYDPIR